MESKGNRDGSKKLAVSCSLSKSTIHYLNIVAFFNINVNSLIEINLNRLRLEICIVSTLTVILHG
jgi:hypothetical protein